MTRTPPEEVAVGLPRNYLRPCLLLLLAEGTSHGYELLEQVAALGLDRVDPGGLYRSLRAMDEEGLVRSTWQPSTTGPARRTYELTDEGREWLHAVAGSLAEFARSLDVYRRRYEALALDASQART
ncbi:poly-beta-hydroxybutyrate-responsive repressor [Blastococcus colisei]|uniref:Poly-beta-hydroxybutyrate-responsive repressor n=1 Tax=Blastococcus colisei TaxID=1564162 RepID=A0A543PEP5_9ACTN|nr:helix-turn-helix transcriptional regulator [Blastococcus colisei]TQN42564.1 poly-beta-hydroxybutyrate-responsive repressor [Blastococcus colisei]